LNSEPESRAGLTRYLERISEQVDHIGVANIHDTVQLYLHEGNRRIPATRVSDGSLRFICLLAILCHPSPPPLICIEEPELGLHPDLMPTIADLMQEASERTQLIVTTHSDVLVDALTQSPEDVIVCEKHDGNTLMRRLSRDDLSTWLEKYSLGNLWTSGQIGGNRF
jgi:predicted ATPase